MGGSHRILIADDDEDLRELLKFHFESNGYDVTAVSNGRDAWDYLTNGRSLPDAIVLDLLMPELDGEEFLRRRHDHDSISAIPTLVLTGVDDEEILSRMFELGADDYVTKPFSPNELTTRIKHLE